MGEKFSISEAAVENSFAYTKAWKAHAERSVIPVIRSFSMRFPSKLADAANAQPIIIQEASGAITEGQAAVFSFYCDFNHSAVDQPLKCDVYLEEPFTSKLSERAANALSATNH